MKSEGNNSALDIRALGLPRSKIEAQKMHIGNLTGEKVWVSRAMKEYCSN